MASSSLSKILPNLFIGLCKRNRLLEPYAEQFSGMGYEPWAIDEQVRTESGRETRPDMILCSTKIGNTILIEWTDATVPDNKQDQFERYSEIKAGDLTTSMAALPPAAVITHDVSVAAHKAYSQAFSDFLEQNGHNFPTLGCQLNGSGITITMEGVGFGESQTNRFFQNGISVNRVPTGYMTFTADQFTDADVAQQIASHVYQRFIQDAGDFNVNEFCPICYDAWPIFSTVIQGRLRNITRNVLLLLAQYPCANVHLIRRISTNPSVFRTANASDYNARKLHSIRTNLSKFVRYVQRRPPIQGDLGL